MKGLVSTVAKISLMVSMLYVSGCAIDPALCNAENANSSIFVKSGCVHSGEYQRKIDVKQQTLAEEQRLNVLFKEVYAALEKEYSEVRGELRNHHAEYSSLKVSLKNLLSEIESKNQGNQALQAEVDKIKSDMTAMEDNKSSVVIEKQVELAELKSRVSDLEGVFEFQ